MLACHQYHLGRTERSLFACLFLAWSVVAGLPVVMPDFLSAAMLLLVGATLVFTCLTQRRTLLSLPVLTLLVVVTLFGYSGGAVGAILCLLTLAELRRGIEGRGNVKPTKDAEVESKRFEAEVSWRGFPELYKQSAPGEAEIFCSKVLGDTQTIVSSVGGSKVGGTDHRTLYSFQSRKDRDLCLSRLSAYENQLLGVLGQVKAPPVSLVFSLK